jgi:predicted DNA-binding protein (UPF0251 family)
MAKPKKDRRVLYPPTVGYFKPQGIPLVQLQQVVLNVDEYEAIRLVDYDGLDQETAAGKLGISRPTCARIVEEAHRKIAEAITQGKAIRIEGGNFVLKKNLMRCRDCSEVWEAKGESGNKGGLNKCPQCGGSKLVDLGAAAGGYGRGRGKRFGRGRQKMRGDGYQ